MCDASAAKGTVRRSVARTLSLIDQRTRATSVSIFTGLDVPCALVHLPEDEALDLTARRFRQLREIGNLAWKGVGCEPAAHVLL